MQKIFFILFISSQLFSQNFDSVTLEKFHETSQKYIDTSLSILKEAAKAELQYTYGTIKLDKNASYDIVSYTLENGHQNFSDFGLNYNYLLTYSHSKMRNTYENFTTDFGVGVGYNIINITDDDYISIGTNIGISFINAVRANKRQNTNLYKLGVRVSFSKQLLDLPLFIYGSTNYSMHYAYTDDNKDDGIFNEAQIGLKMKPKEYTDFVFSSGVKYKLASTEDLKIKSSEVYIGVSYLFE